MVPDTEKTWLEAAQGKTQRELEALVADKSPGDAPDAAGPAAPRRRVLRFEVAADTFATFREAMQRLERAAGGHLDHDALLLAMARHVLGGPTDDGRSSYQISLHVCATCSRGEQVARGELVPVDAAVVEMAACDEQHLGQCWCPYRRNEQPTKTPTNPRSTLARPSVFGPRPRGRRDEPRRERRDPEARHRATHPRTPTPARPTEHPARAAPRRARAIGTAARSPAALTPSSSTSTTFSGAPMVA